MTTAVRWDHCRTDRLVLAHVVETDVAELHEIHADPRVWTHAPELCPTDISSTEALVASSVAAWRDHGLSYWSVREHEGGQIIGCGGCRPVADKNRWNLYYRFRPEVQGKGYASEVASMAIEAATSVDSERAVVAVMLEHNVGSVRVAQKAGLQQVFRGPEPDMENAVRLIYADRPITL